MRKKLFIDYLSVRARKFKRKSKSCLLFVYPAGPGNLKKGQKLFIVCLSGRARKFKRKAKGCLSFVNWQGREV